MSWRPLSMCFVNWWKLYLHYFKLTTLICNHSIWRWLWCLIWESGHVVHLYIRSFITHRFLHDSQGPGLSLLMWWLLTRCGRWWPSMSLVNQHVQLWNLMPLLISINIKGFMKGTTLFQWPWRCTMHLNVIWIISLRSVFVFSTIDDWKVIYPCLFAFKFLGDVVILLFNMF